MVNFRDMRTLFLLLILAISFVGCDKEPAQSKKTTKTVTFEDFSFDGGDAENNTSVNGAWWEQYIDSQQYGGSLLYGGNGYAWYDNATTLTSYLPDYWSDGTFFGGGIAISDYVASPTTPTYEEQLTIGLSPVSGKNFAVCYVATNQAPPFIEFKYGEGVVEQLSVTSTVYTNFVVQNGNAFSSAMPSNGYIRITATGVDALGNKTGELEMLLFNGRSVSGWRKWSLSALGTVKRVEFRMYEGTTENGQHIDSTAEYPTYPFYFAMDDIVVTK